MDVRLPDGTVIQNIPDGMSRADLTAKLAANGYDTSKLDPGGVPVSAEERAYGARQAAPAPAAPQDSMIGKAFGVIEPAISMGTGAIGSAIGSLAGVGKSILGGHYGTQQGVREGEQLAGNVADSMTYQPRTQTGQAIAGKVGEVLDRSGLIGVPIPELNSLSRMAGSTSGAVRGLAKVNAAAQGAQDAAMTAGAKPLSLLPKKAPPLSGVGAAMTPDATLRAQRAASLPVPIPLTKGQLTRDFAQVQFEREAAKTPEGAPLNDRYAQQNAMLGQNLDAFGDQTGGQAYSLRSAGRSVVDALEAKQAAKKSEISAAYQQARDAGHMAAPIEVSALTSYINKNRPASLNAPILNSVESAIRTLDPGESGMVPLNDMEELRQMTGNLAQPGTPNAVYGGQIKGLIDRATEGQGGPLYQQARRQYENYANEFQNRNVISKLLADKKGTNDRAVPFEDVLHHTILNSSLDDVKHVFRVLEAHPVNSDPAIVAAGQQAARDLRGAVINHIKDRTFSNAGADTMGNVVGSEAKLKNIVNELDRDGKLEAIFGKQGAQQVRDVRDMATDLYTSPNGTIQNSNNANRIVAALNKVAGMGAGVPLVGPAVRYAAKQVQSQALKKQVNAALMPLSQLPRKP